MRRQNRTFFLLLAITLILSLFAGDAHAVTKTPYRSKSRSRATWSPTPSRPSPSLTISSTQRPTDTGNETRSKSLSIPLPVKPAVVTLESSVVIDSACIVSPDATTENVACRTIVFRMVNDGFPYDNNGQYHKSYSQYLLQPFDDGDDEPFGLGAQWDYIASKMQITANVTHLTMVLPQVVGLAIDRPSTLFANFTAYYTLRLQAPAQPSAFSIGVTATPTNIVSDQQKALQIATAVLAALSMAAPLDPSMLDLQSTIMIGSSVCSQAQPRALATTGRRALFPSIGTGDPLGQGLWHGLVIICIFTVLHLLVVYAVMQRYSCGFFDAGAKVYFPSMSLACAQLLQPGIAYASFSLLFSADTIPALRMATIFTSVYSCLVVILPMTWMLKFVQDTPRDHHRQLMEFPMLVRKLLPTTSWGPAVKSQPWSTPFGCCRARGRRYVTLHLGVVTYYAFIFAVAPGTPKGCSAQLFFGMLGCVGHAFVLISRRPFRATFFSIASGVNAAALALPLGIGFAHTFNISGDTGSTAASLMSVVQLIALLRTLAGLLSHAIELVLLRPNAWPDAESGLVQAVTVATRLGASNTADPSTFNGGVKKDGNADADNANAPGERSEDITVYLQQLREAERTRVLAEGHLEQLRTLPKEVRDTRRVLGDPEPLPVRVIPRRTFVTTAAGAQRDPLLAVHRFDGPLPPALQHKYAFEYERL